MFLKQWGGKRTAFVDFQKENMKAFSLGISRRFIDCARWRARVRGCVSVCLQALFKQNNLGWIAPEFHLQINWNFCHRLTVKCLRSLNDPLSAEVNLSMKTVENVLRVSGVITNKITPFNFNIL